MTAIRVALADDHPIVLTGIKALIETEPDITVVSASTSGLSAAAEIAATIPDVAVVDISIGDMDGIELIRRLKAEVPSVRLLALTVHEDQSYLQQALLAGVDGYLLKRSAAEDLVRAVRTVARQEMYLDPAIAAKAVAPPPGRLPNADILSERETSVLRLLAQGFTTKEIAERLLISIKTVETYKVRAAEKLNLRTRVQIIRFAAAQGWFEAPL
ncbi:response regulator transcription factor [Telmatospirillum siberiense]|uniref:DNA-binding response regulator n=1 Tax=Telmatospirillum siberiense TaxID=382514 RepID=A0A2N3Q0M8_9PROT|nr:response regulator transcription factor [Telmatospirillum siberiense]PKU26219.1 DNA-binding response regulator [Telmatospirillum siberiense]